jgi:hypothetical protein
VPAADEEVGAIVMEHASLVLNASEIRVSAPDGLDVLVWRH